MTRDPPDVWIWPGRHVRYCGVTWVVNTVIGDGDAREVFVSLVGSRKQTSVRFLDLATGGQPVPS